MKRRTWLTVKRRSIKKVEIAIGAQSDTSRPESNQKCHQEKPLSSSSQEVLVLCQVSVKARVKEWIDGRPNLVNQF